MKEFTQFPEDGIYVVKEPFKGENMFFSAGEIIGIMRLGGSPYVLVIKTGRFGGDVNHMEVENMAKLRKLDFDEINAITGDMVVSYESFETMSGMYNVCRLIAHNVPEFA